MTKLSGKIAAVLAPLLFAVSTLSTAADASANGRVVQGTPFDRQIMQTGVFDSPSYSNEGSRSMQDLFLKAKSFRYMTDRKGNQWQSAEETESRRAGDCEDKAVWLYTRLKENGYSDVNLVIGRYRSIDRTYHVWVTFSDTTGTYILDATTQKRIWKAGEFDSGFYKPIYSYDGQRKYRYEV